LPKSWIVSGFSDTCTNVVPRVIQWAETQRMAAGVGKASPISAQPRLNPVSTIAFIGLPWPTNSAGIRSLGRSCPLNLLVADAVIWRMLSSDNQRAS
jgi:hypothetical protein